MHNPTIFRVSRNLTVIARISKSYENKKRGFSFGKILKSKIVRLIGTMLCSLMNFTEKCNVLKISNYRFLFFS